MIVQNTKALGEQLLCPNCTIILYHFDVQMSSFFNTTVSFYQRKEMKKMAIDDLVLDRMYSDREFAGVEKDTSYKREEEELLQLSFNDNRENTFSATQAYKTSNTAYHIKTLKSKAVWVNRQYQTVKGRQTKIPKNSKTGGNAMSNNPETWSDFFTAQSATKKFGYNGIGVMFAPLDNGYAVCGIDIDAHHKESNEFALEILDLFKNTYAEKSPSGNGYHVLFVAK